jgi:hypothetical protein
MMRLTIGQSARDDARVENIGMHAADTADVEQEHSGMQRLRHHAVEQYDWMDHHSTFETCEW